MDSPLSLYLHIPFCRTRCTYCTFNTYAGLDALREPYVQALADEIQMVGKGRHLSAHTIYFGGGTPSLLSPDQLSQLTRTCTQAFEISKDAEISLEANPGTITVTGLQALRTLGINRLSLGVQSANGLELTLLGRIHSFPEAQETFTQARHAGFDNINLDLIYGIPNQTLGDWQATVEAVLTWEPEHISMYALSIEQGTSLHRQIARGELSAPDPDLAADMYLWASECLECAGLMQYEISNWAVPGYECRHNLQYWRNNPFLGFGAGAHGFAKDCRYWNVLSIETYLARMQESEQRDFPFSPAFEDYEQIDLQTTMAETVILSLRLVRKGISASEFERRFEHSLDEVYGPTIKDLVALGLIEDLGDCVRLTRPAYLISNQIFIRFLPEPKGE